MSNASIRTIVSTCQFCGHVTILSHSNKQCNKTKYSRYGIELNGRQTGRSRQWMNSFIAIKRNIAFTTFFLYVILARLYFKHYASKCKSGITCVYLSVILGVMLRHINISKITFVGGFIKTSLMQIV